MENAYSSLSVAIRALQEEGFTEDFNLCNAGVENKNRNTIHLPSELDVIRYYRFEGMSDPDDNTVLYVIETNSGEKGLLMDAYGAYAGNIPGELLEKLRIVH
jgi:hypothetical protein